MHGSVYSLSIPFLTSRVVHRLALPLHLFSRQSLRSTLPTTRLFSRIMSATNSSSTTSSKAESSIASEFLSFINQSPSHFHATAAACRLFEQAGFTRLREKDDWTDQLKPSGSYFYTRNQSSLIAFTLPHTYTPPYNHSATASSATPSSHPFLILAAHTDSPVLKVKPVSKVTKSGYLQVGVECYGGGLWHTWFDRDLSVAGRVVVKDGEKYATRLVAVKRPVLRIPNLAIHLNREVNEKGFIFNKQTHLLPILATAVKEQLNAVTTDLPSSAASTSDSKPASDSTHTASAAAATSAAASFTSSHHSLLLKLVAKELHIDASAIVDLELALYDTQPACLGGAYDEFIYSRALDNLMMSFISTHALIRHTKAAASSSSSSAASTAINVVALFDNEEVGSESYQGAGASLRNFLARIHGNSLTYDAAVRRSLLVSADMAHAVHPNYAEAHEEHHRPQLHCGLVIKQNANQRYATSPLTSFHLRALAERRGIAVQRFVVRNDTACGSTIGPILSANTGVRVVDVGVPQLSMHSIREMCGVGDVESAERLFVALFEEYESIDGSLEVEGE